MLNRTGLGVLAGILSMGVEGLGSLFLIRALLQAASGAEASQFTLVTYVWLTLNVIGNALGFVASRAAARLDDRGHLAALALRIRDVAGAIVAPVAAIGLAALAAEVLQQRMSLEQALPWLGFVGGHLVRVAGLARISLHVGDGHLGADKWYQFGCATLFYGLAVPAARHGVAVGGIALLYAVAALAAYAGAAAWRAGRLPAPVAGPAISSADADPVDSRRALGWQTADMVGYAAAGFLAGNADAFIARHLLGDQDFVEYALAAKLGQVVALVAGLVPTMFGPRITRFYRAGALDDARAALRRAATLAAAMAAIGAAVLIVLAAPIARWFTPLHHAVFGQVLWIVALGAVLQAVNLALANAINSVAARGLVRVTLASAGTAVAMSLLGSRLGGAPGVAAGTVAGSLVMLAGAGLIARGAFRSRQQPAPEGRGTESSRC